MIDANKCLKSLKSGLYEWNADTQTLSHVTMGAVITMRKSVFHLLDETNKQSENSTKAPDDGGYAKAMEQDGITD